MLTKSDTMSILIRLENSGLNVDKQLEKVLISKTVPIDVLKFIVQNNGMEANNFYEMLRKKHNQKKSKVYLNIVKESQNESEAITTLVCLLTQILLFGNKLKNREIFFKEIRASEISEAINEYFTEGNIESVFSLLKIIKADLLVLEYLDGRRELE